MLSIFIDPRIKNIKILEQAVEIIKKYQPCNIVCFFNTHQAEFFKEHQFDPICYSFNEWPLEERNDALGKMVQGFCNQIFKPYTTLNYTVGGKKYRLNVLRFQGPNFFLRNLFFPVAKTMHRYLTEQPVEDGIAIGGSVFFHHISFCLTKQKANLKFYELERAIPQNRFSIYAVSALVRVSAAIFKRIFFGRKIVFLPTNTITARIISNLKGKRGVEVVSSIQRLIPVVMLFDFGFSSEYLKRNIQTIVDIFDKEALGTDEETRLAYAMYVDYLKNHSFEEELKYCLALIRILNMLRPEVVIHFNFNGDTYPFKLWSEHHDKPSINIQHGFQGRFLMNVRYEIESDYYFAWADLPYDRQLNPTAVFKPVGNPLFKSLPSNPEEIKQYSIKRILLAPGALHYSKADADERFWRDLLLFFEETPLRDVTVNVKLHRKDRYKDLTLRKLRQNSFLFKLTDESIRNSLLTCDLVITTVSTVVLDAFGFDKPVILVNNALEDEYYSVNNACIVVKSVGQMVQQLNLLRLNPRYVQECLERQRVFYKRFCGDEASDVITKDIMDLLKT